MSMENTPSSNRLNTTSWLYIGIALVVGVLLGSSIWVTYMNTLWTVLVDNPTGENIAVSINDDDYVFLPWTWRVKIPYTMDDIVVSLDDKEVWRFTKGLFDGDLLINPTLTTYVRQSYAYTDTSDNKVDGKLVDGLVENTICLDGKEYTWYNLQIYTGVAMSKDRDYGMDELSPEETIMEGDYKIVTELTRQEWYMDEEKDHKQRKDC